MTPKLKPALALLLTAAFAPAAASAQEPPPAATAQAPSPTPAAGLQASEPARGIGLMVGLKAGGLLPFSKLGIGATPELELGYFVLGRALAIYADLGYAQASASGTRPDVRVPDMTYGWDLTERDLTTSLGGLYRFDKMNVVPYVGLAFRLHLQESVVNGKGGTTAPQPLGENRETRTAAGGVLLGGAELKLGPGSLLGELEIGYAALNHQITGDTNIGGLALRIGYRIIL